MAGQTAIDTKLVNELLSDRTSRELPGPKVGRVDGGARRAPEATSAMGDSLRHERRSWGTIPLSAVRFATTAR